MPLPRLSAPLLLTALLACGDSNGPGPGTYAGLYTATTLRLTPEGLSPIDLLAGGSTLTITINADSSTSGQLFIPAALTGDVDLEEDMAGGATITNSSITFSQGADTFIRDLTFERHDGYLLADEVLSDEIHYVVRLDQ